MMMPMQEGDDESPQPNILEKKRSGEQGLGQCIENRLLGGNDQYTWKTDLELVVQY